VEEEEGNGMEELEQECVVGGDVMEGEKKRRSGHPKGLRETSDAHDEG
jgi:hypothetical protein